MQTFLPYPDFQASAAALDSRRLGKQRVEAYQILRILRGESAGVGWRHHPAVAMWRGYEGALGLYMNAMITEWMRRGYKNTMTLATVPVTPDMPPWIGDEALHSAYRSNLLRKAPDFYRQYGWTEPPDLPYVWPAGDKSSRDEVTTNPPSHGHGRLISMSKTQESRKASANEAMTPGSST